MENKKRRQMLAAALGILLLVGLVQLLVASGFNRQLWRLQCAVLLGFYAAASLACAVACLWGEYFSQDGSMQRGVISAVLVAILCTGQLAAGGAAFLYESMEFDRQALLQAEAAHAAARQALHSGEGLAPPGELVEAVTLLEPEGIRRPLFVAAEGGPAEGGAAAGQAEEEAYRFPVMEGTVLVYISTRQLRQSMLRVALSILSTAVGTAILAVELVLFATRLIDGGAKGPDGGKSCTGSRKRKRGLDSRGQDMAFPWLRQVAFLYFVAARLCASFLPAYGLRLASGTASPQMAASLAAMAELLFTCAGLLLGSRLAGRHGWRPALCLGFGLTALSSVLGAAAPGFILYLASRCVSGLGYGLAWMTLRELARVQQDARGALVQLSCGIYAGMNFGVALGSLLAQQLGGQAVLLVAAGLGAAALAPLYLLPNARPGQSPAPQGAQAGGGLAALLALCLLAVLPTGLLAAFQGYYLPLYIPATGGSTVETGAVQLAYGVCIVYLGPAIVRLVGRFAAGAQVVLQLALLGGGLLLFAATGGQAAAALAMLLFAVGDSFGAAAQNTQFFTTRFAARLGGARALTVFSLGKKLAESLGPVVFGLVASGTHIAVIGAGTLAAGAAYALVLRQERRAICKH